MPRVGKPELKESLLTAGLYCFARRGYHATTMDEIAAEAGVSKGAIYWHYKDKRELFLNIMRERRAALEEAGSQAVVEDSSPGEILRAIMLAIFRFYSENREFASLIGLLRSGKDAPFGEEFYHELQEFYRSSRERLVPLFQYGIETGAFVEAESDAMAAWVLATIDGTVMQWVIDPESIDLKHYAPILSEHLLRGIEKR